MQPSLEGVRARIARANDHFEHLKAVLAEHERTNPSHAGMIEREAEERIITAVVEHVPEVPMTARLLIGDVVHALAVALDNLVFQLSFSYQIAKGNPKAFEVCDRTKLYFPIFATSTPGDLRTIERRLSLMGPVPAEIIRDMQPYRRMPEKPTGHPLWALRQLDVIDKHRVVLAVTHSGRVDSVSIAAPGQEEEVFRNPDGDWQRLEKGMELLQISLPMDARPEPGVALKLTMARRILFAETSLCDGDNVLYVLKNMIPFVEREIVDVLAPHVT